MLGRIATSARVAAGAGLVALLTAGPAPAQEYTLRLPNVDPPYSEVGELRYPNHVWGMMEVFADSVEAFSNGRIEVELYHSGMLGDLRENMESTRVGALEGATPNEAIVSIFYPEVQIVTLPYAFQNAAVAWEVLDGPFGRKLFDGLTEQGFRAVAVGENAGFRIWGNNVRPIVAPEDMQGLKIRTMEIPAHQEMVTSLGASPTAVPWLEVYSALQTGVVDGAELPVIGTLQQNLQEVLRYITVDNHVYSLAFIIISERWFQELPPELQQAVTLAGRIAAVTSRGLSQSLANDVLATFSERGLEVTHLSADQQAAFRDVAQPGVLDWLVEQLGQDLVDEFLTAVREAEAGLGLEPSL